MNSGAVAALLPDGRLHLQHGPIDLVISVEGAGRDAAFRQAAARFNSVLTDLTADLPNLTKAYRRQTPCCSVAARMYDAVAPLAADRFITPMAAVAGAVADEICAVIAGCSVDKATVNNGGDIAFLLVEGQVFRAAAPSGPLEIKASSPVRGVATSGWRGRSQSLGIADAVTVFAATAARADAAATLIANAVDLPGHLAITRAPAREVEALPQLGDRLVTVAVGALADEDVSNALTAGSDYARRLVDGGLIHGAVLLLNGARRVIASSETATALPTDLS